MNKRVLDIGCGDRKMPGAIGVDFRPSTQVDVVCDLTKFPWPFEEGSFDEIIAHNILEHPPNVIATMEEIHRIGTPDAVPHVKTPHFASLESWEDPTHVHHFSCESFDYFCDSERHVKHDTSREFRLESKQLHFGGHLMALIGRLLHRLSPRAYEKRWAFIFRPSGMEICLAIVK